MVTRSGPVCAACGQVVAAITYVFLASPDGGEEAGLCADCLSVAKAQGRLSARITPIDQGRRRSGPRRPKRTPRR